MSEHAAGTPRALWECSRHASNTQSLGKQSATRVGDTRLLGTQHEWAERAGAPCTDMVAPSIRGRP
eukprot:10867991-Alexandrium_andersonii.AAC.1